MHDPLTDWATVPAMPVHPAVLASREPLRRIVVELLAVRDGSLGAAWRWRPDDPEDNELRYGFYRIHERLETAIGAIEVGRSGSAAPIGPAVPALAAMAAARWELHGVLTSLPEDAWDADPGGGEWSIRTTVGHIVMGQQSYGWYNAWYLRARAAPLEAVRPPDSVMPPEKSDEEAALGSPVEVADLIDGIVDANIAASAALDLAALDVGARWAGVPVSVGFRFGRYGSHIREHTIQVDKTLAMLGREPTEVERLVRLILATYGRLEALLIGRSATELDRPFANGSSATDILAAAIADSETTASSVRAAASA